MSDLIERQAAIHAILGQPPEPHYPSWYAEQIKELPSAQPEISLMTVTVAPDSEEIKRVLRRIKDAPVMVLPSAQPERKMGHWIEKGVNADKTHNIVCSECGEGYKTRGHAKSIVTRAKWRFCPSCGADMRNEQKEDGE